MKLLPQLLTTKACLTKLTVVLLAAVFAFGAGQTAAAQSGGGMDGHGQGTVKDAPTAAAQSGGGMDGHGQGTAKDAPTAAAQSGGSMGGHGQGMANEDPIPFTRDIERAAAGILSQLKAGRTMDARSSVSRLSAATDKLIPHITDAGLKDRLIAAVNDIKTIAGAKNPDLLDLEDKVDALQPLIEEAREKLQGMNF
jgi:hypothetical protein